MVTSESMAVRFALSALLLGSVACNPDTLLRIKEDALTGASAGNVLGAQALRAAAIADFAEFYSGDVNATLVGALLGDELINAYPGYEHLDSRSFNENSDPNPWISFSTVRRSSLFAIDALWKYLPDSATRKSELGHLYALHGYSLVLAAELYCNGLPFANVDAIGTVTYDPHPYTNADLYHLAVTYFDSALAVFPAADSLRNLARIGKARALLDLDEVDAAAAVVGSGGDGTASDAIATTFVYNVEYSPTTIANGIAVWIPDNANFGVPSTPKGQNGLDWSADPRPAVQPFLRIGADGSTPIYPPGVPWSLTDDSPVPLATGQEARLIEAEASLRAGDASWLPILNALRAGSAFALQLPPLTDPGTTASRVDILFRERAMWMYLTGHRLGDLRRLVRQYGRSQDQVFPTGPYPKGGEFGSDVNITPPYAERNNPTYHGCLDRAA